MTDIKEQYKQMGIDSKVYDLGDSVLKDARDAFERIAADTKRPMPVTARLIDEFEGATGFSLVIVGRPGLTFGAASTGSVVALKTVVGADVGVLVIRGPITRSPAVTIDLIDEDVRSARDVNSFLSIIRIRGVLKITLNPTDIEQVTAIIFQDVAGIPRRDGLDFANAVEKADVTDNICFLKVKDSTASIEDVRSQTIESKVLDKEISRNVVVFVATTRKAEKTITSTVEVISAAVIVLIVSIFRIYR